MVLHFIHAVVLKFYLKGILCLLVIMASHMQICWLTLIMFPVLYFSFEKSFSFGNFFSSPRSMPVVIRIDFSKLAYCLIP